MTDDAKARARLIADRDAWEAKWCPVFDAVGLGLATVFVGCAMIGLAFLLLG